MRCCDGVSRFNNASAGKDATYTMIAARRAYDVIASGQSPTPETDRRRTHVRERPPEQHLSCVPSVVSTGITSP